MAGPVGASERSLNAPLHPGRGARGEATGLDGVVIASTSTRPRRLRKLPRTEIRGRRVPVAVSRRAPLLGLALLDRHRAGAGLLIPGCRSVHTFGMRFAVDLCFLDIDLQPFGLRRAVPPRRLVFERRAQAVLELPATTPGETG